MVNAEAPKLESVTASETVLNVGRYTMNIAVHGHDAAERTMIDPDGTITYDM